MKKAGDMWILDEDTYFDKLFRKTKDQFELHNLQLATQQVTNITCAIDVGAHYGSWTRFFSRMFKTVYAFEPHPKIFECLERNTEMMDNVIAVNSAIGDKEDKQRLVDGMRKRSSGMSYLTTDGGPKNVSIKTIDSYNLKNVGLIKVDVEGYEYFALRGAEETMLRCKPIIHFEDKWGERFGVKKEATVKYLQGLGATVLDTYDHASSKDYIMGWK